MPGLVENFARMSEKHRELLCSMAQQMASDRNARAKIGSTKRSGREAAPADQGSIKTQAQLSGLKKAGRNAQASREKNPKKLPPRRPIQKKQSPSPYFRRFLRKPE
jgi:hypothetical protein